MIPLVDYEQELEFMRSSIRRVAEEEGARRRGQDTVGSDDRAAAGVLPGGPIARHADFFSFGTNDLTQTGLGFSREDIEARILERYIDVKILDRSPFETIDTPGVGQMVRMGAWLGRTTKDELKLGVCGEHGGDPESIAFFHDSGIDYVSCSPPRVPVARLAAAQAAIRRRRPRCVARQSTCSTALPVTVRSISAAAPAGLAPRGLVVDLRVQMACRHERGEPREVAPPLPLRSSSGKTKSPSTRAPGARPKSVAAPCSSRLVTVDANDTTVPAASRAASRRRAPIRRRPRPPGA